MPLPQTLTVKYEEHSIRLTITRSEVFMAGEFAGNVHLHLDCDPSLFPIVCECLHLRVPGSDSGVERIASGSPNDGLMLVFGCDAIALLASVPERLCFLWCGEPLLEIVPELAESVPIEEIHRLLDPLEILGQPRMQTENPIRIAAERDWIAFLPAFVLVGFGAGLSSMATQMPYGRLTGGILLFLGTIVALLAWLPKRQVWLDRNQREILFLEGRTVLAKKALAHVTRRSVDGFSHVRLCEREYAIEAGDDTHATRIDYLVSLEGPIPFGFDDGRVHSRSDALHLAKFSGERTARRCAAEAGYHVGLRILVASDW
jgi:hypothetical protein